MRYSSQLIDEKHNPIASGSHGWENRFENGVWTYHLDDVWTGLQDAYKNLKADVLEKYGVKCEICAYYFDVEKEVCVQRVAQRNKDRSQINIPIEVVYSFSDKIIPPTFEEGFKIIKIVREGKVAEVIENE